MSYSYDSVFSETPFFSLWFKKNTSISFTPKSDNLSTFGTNHPRMPIVKFTYALKRFFPDLKDTSLQAATLTELVAAVDDVYPGIRRYVLDEQGALRQHVNIFVNGELIRDRRHLSDAFAPDSEIYIMQALSGG